MGVGTKVELIPREGAYGEAGHDTGGEWASSASQKAPFRGPQRPGRKARAEEKPAGLGFVGNLGWLLAP